MSGGEDRSSLLSALDAHDEGICVLDRDYRFLYSNDACARLLRTPAEDLTGNLLFDLFTEGRETEVFTAYEQAFATGLPQEFRLWYGQLEGWFRVRAIPRGDDLVVFFRDVNAEQEVAQERADLAVLQEQSGARADRLLAVVAELSRARTLTEVLDVVIVKGFGLLGGYGGGVGFTADDGRHVEVVDLRGFGGDIAERWTGTFPIDTDVPMMLAARTGEAQFYPTLESVRERHPEFIGDFGERTNAFAALPLTIDQRTTGALVVMFENARAFDSEERHFMLTLASLCAQALERARLSAQEREIAATLQRSLLPRLPRLPEADVAVRYVAGAPGTQVGGDWYDVLALGAGRLALVVGDVMGRGVAAAALMGQVRAALRAYALLDLPPAQLLGALDTVVSTVAEGSFVTCCYAVFDPADSTLTVASAGHLPPVIASPAGSHVLSAEVDPPLGTSFGHHSETVTELSADSVVVMCSDGLVETRTRDASEGMDLLAATLRGLVDEPLEAVADAVLVRLLTAGSADDTALLLVRPVEAGSAQAPWHFIGPDLQDVSRLRRSAVAQAKDIGQPPDLIDAVALVLSELATNAIRYGKGAPAVRLRLRPDLAVIEVQDGSPALPRPRQATPSDEGGRGLELVAALTRQWGWRASRGGKVVWAELIAPA